MNRATDQFLREMLSLPEVQIVEGDMSSERSLTVGGREFLHIHGNTTLHLLLPKDVKAEAIADGQAQQHPYAPKSGMIALYLKSGNQLPAALRLAKISYEYVSSKVQRLKSLRSTQLTLQDSQLAESHGHGGI